MKKECSKGEIERKKRKGKKEGKSGRYGEERKEKENPRVLFYSGFLLLLILKCSVPSLHKLKCNYELQNEV